jgi:glutaminyl-tRNA synthetase
MEPRDVGRNNMTVNMSSSDFIRDIIDQDNQTNRFDGRVHTRFPPEPNGFLHIGHAKSICLNFGIAADYKGQCNLRFDDTNPSAEEETYVQSIINDVRWLGFDWEDHLYFASDYFEQMYAYAIDLIKAGKAYVDDLSAEEIRAYRGTLTEPGTVSPHRDRSIEENLDLFQRMRAGEFPDGTKVLRAKIDMTHPNMNLRDPVMYRILRAVHHRTGDAWCVYPTYDWAHGLEDSLEHITHSICTLEFENHRPLYDWFLDQLDIFHPQQIEFARLNLTYTVMSKRMLRELVEKGLVCGWDDPRLPTIQGMRRRGYPPAALRSFCQQIGVSKSQSTIPVEFLEHCVREELNATAPRRMAVLRPLKVILENYPADTTEEIAVENNPEDPSAGTREVPFGKELYIEISDFQETPPKKFYRLAPGREVRLKNAYFITCEDVIKNAGTIIELRCTIDFATRGGDAPDGRRPKSTLHWVSAGHALDAEVRLYDRLFTVENPMGQGQDFTEFLNPASLEILPQVKVEPAVATLQPFDRCQFLRHGYFCVDPLSTNHHLVLNRTVGLRDSWAKISQKPA